MTNEELWKAVLSEVETGVSKANFLTWFKNTRIADNQEGTITISVPNTFIKEWLEDKYNKIILKALRNYSSSTRNTQYIISSFIDTNKTKSEQTKETASFTPVNQMEFKEFQTDQETSLNPRYTFDSFIIGSFNEMAHAASIAVTKNVGTLYNPLFIYGGVGLGKTHLIQSIGNTIKQNKPEMAVKYVTSEKFTSELISSIQNNRMVDFKNKYRKYDVLIIDDIQFLAGKTKAQEEFFYTFNTLYEDGKQIIISADQPPKSIKELEERLRSRFEGGIMTDVSEPEYESRLAILNNKATSKQFLPSKEIMEYIASTIKDNVRELEGALNSLIIREKFAGHPLSLDEVKEILSKNTRPQKPLTAVQIIKTVADFYNISEKSLFEKTRKKEVVMPRQIAMYILREDFNGSYPYIGQKFGGRDHTTAIHSYDKIARDIKKDSKLAEEIKQIRENLYKI